VKKEYDYLFIIGAAKCGTTALADLLDQHPNICLSSPKEPDFFTNKIFPKGMDWYESCFKDKESQIRLDSSVSYTAGWGGSSQNIAERIKAFAPNAKLIYMMRDPIERTWSSYWHALRNGRKEPEFIDAISAESDHVTASQYCARIEDYLAHFDREHLLLLTQHELKKSPVKVLEKVAKHIGQHDLCSAISTTQRQVNSSYKLNGFGQVILKIIPLDVVKKCAHFANRHLPDVISKAIKNVMSDPVPKMNEEQASPLREAYAEDLAKLEARFDIRLKTSHWWK
tara:strand:- start:7404 stop:8252 length:849 start_codon:yes stop_codon:yes gene_type:complete